MSKRFETFSPSGRADIPADAPEELAAISTLELMGTSMTTTPEQRAEWKWLENDAQIPLSVRTALPALISHVDALEAERERLRAALSDHHKRCLDEGDTGIPDGEGGYIGIDMASEYSDSGLFERTASLLANHTEVPPRGGLSNGWWANWVLEVRKRKRSEARITALEAENARLKEALEVERILKAELSARCKQYAESYVEISTEAVAAIDNLSQRPDGAPHIALKNIAGGLVVRARAAMGENE